jgi:hypothetical protein
MPQERGGGGERRCNVKRLRQVGKKEERKRKEKGKNNRK